MVTFGPSITSASTLPPPPGLLALEPTSAGERAGTQAREVPVYRELWFMVVMAAVALVLLAIILGLLLHRTVSRQQPPLTRERPPLVPMPLEKRGPMAVSTPSNSYLFDTVPDTTTASNTVTLKGFTIHREEVADCKVVEEEDGIVTVSTLHVTTLAQSPNSLHRSISEVIDKKNQEEEKGEPWERQKRWHDSGMFMEDEEFVDTIKGFSTVRKEHTMFTDTNL
ncbi:hypothetical protein ACEWY4_022198 [Coilia grayii]|uniref:Uncharacterized protein n=1 Tax=Coilia grayii TaxID=363190 RepID=A0ABD1J7T0_9TELE